jgi:phage terminase large subunit-like protein
MVEATIRTVDRSVAYLGIHASRNKQARAEPVSALYEQKRISHVGMFKDLEDELCSWAPNSNMPSPNRLDALVWAFTELMLRHRTAMIDINPSTNYRGDVWL